jgi:excisionase family DNA binding protein
METRETRRELFVGQETISVESAAKTLGIGRQTAYNLAREGRFPGAIRLGRRIVVSKRVLERFLDGQDWTA